MGVWKAPGETKGQATLEGNHDNPVSNTHQADRRKTSKGVGWLGAKTAKATAGKGNVSNK